MARTSQSSPPGLRGLPAAILSLAGFAGAFAVASCCALPLILSALGIGSAGFVGLAVWAGPHRDLLLLGAAGCLGTAAVLYGRQRHTPAACAPGGVCLRQVVRLTTTAGLAVGWILLVLGYLYA